MSVFDGLCYLKAFPSTEWARQPDRIWRNVVLHVEAHRLERVDIPGPLALITNLRGTAQCRIDQRDFQVDEGAFALSVPGAEFTLRYDDGRPVEAFNVHFSDALVAETLAALSAPNELAPHDKDFSNIVPVVRRQSPAVSTSLRALYEIFVSTKDPLARESTHLALLSTLLAENQLLFAAQSRLSALRRTTRRELFMRLNRAVDYMHACFAQPLDLRQLARVSCISRFHFLRCFKTLMGVTPQRYLASVRLQEARRMLERTGLPLAEISQRVGYAEASSLSRAFKRHLGSRPTDYRATPSPSRAHAPFIPAGIRKARRAEPLRSAYQGGEP